MKHPALIINADDFGRDTLTNRAVLEAFRNGLCSSATLMPNMPGFEEACELVHENRLTAHIGAHLVLRDGAPLTDGIRYYPRFCSNQGQLCFSRPAYFLPAFFLSVPEQTALAQELRAQIARCRQQRIPLTHVDSHYHTHTEWAVASVLLPILKEEKIPYMRISRNCGPHMGLHRRMYKRLMNGRFKRAGVDRTRYFGSINDYVYRKMHSNKAAESFEVMVHPRYDRDDRLIDDPNADLLEDRIRRIESYRTAVSFSGVHRQ